MNTDPNQKFNDVAIDEEHYVSLGVFIPTETFAEDIMIGRFSELPNDLVPDRWTAGPDEREPGYTRVSMIFSRPREAFDGLTIMEGRDKLFRALGATDEEAPL